VGMPKEKKEIQVYCQPIKEALEQFSSYQYVRTPGALLQACVVLGTCQEIAIDLEFDRDRYAYGFTLCLIQVYGKGICYLFDPFAGLDFEPLFELFERNDIVKILHSPGEDLQLLHLMGCYPKNMFDTERSARILNYGAFGLGSLLKSIVGIEVDKSQQKSNWTHSPLSDAQLKYAARDVAYLVQLREELQMQAMQKGVMSWLNEENAAWDDYRAEEKPAGHFANKEDSKRLPPYQLMVYNAVLGLRDAYAKELNKPGYQVIGKELAMDVVFQPELLDNWMQQKGVHPKVKTQEFKAELKAVIEAANEEATRLGLARKNVGSHLTLAQREELAQEKERLLAIVHETYRPIFNVLLERYGEFSAAYILSEKTMLELVAGKLQLSDLPYRYRAEIIQKIAVELGIQLPNT
jgi:ribonuclease D